MVLYEWDSQQRVGPELVEPVLMSWDPSRSLLALAYASQILLVRPKPSFEVRKNPREHMTEMMPRVLNRHG